MDRPVEITRSYADCKMCMDMADMCDQIPDCDLCKNPKGTWVTRSLICLAQRQLLFWRMAR
jgi:hypothetical protein